MEFLDEEKALSIIKAVASSTSQTQSSISASVESLITMNPHSSLILMNTGAVVMGDLIT
jgi:hypothetical protein